MSNKDDVPVILVDRFSIFWRGVEKIFGNTDQFRILAELVRRHGRFVSHEELRDVVDKPEMTSEALRNAIYSIKQKLKPESADLVPRIQSVVGYYRFE